MQTTAAIRFFIYDLQIVLNGIFFHKSALKSDFPFPGTKLVKCWGVSVVAAGYHADSEWPTSAKLKSKTS